MEGVRIIGGETVVLSSLIRPRIVARHGVRGCGDRTSAGGRLARAGRGILARRDPLCLPPGQSASEGYAGAIRRLLPPVTLLLEAGLRAVEYAVLAAALAWLVRQHWAGVLAHIGLGVLVGVIFGAIIAAFITPDDLGGWIAEELVFPAGCALIIFVSEVLVGVLNADTGPSVIDPT